MYVLQEFFMRAPYIPMDLHNDVNLLETCCPSSSSDLTHNHPGYGTSARYSQFDVLHFSHSSFMLH